MEGRVHESRSVDQHDLVARGAVELEYALQGGDPVTDLHGGAELLVELTLQRLRRGLAELRPSAPPPHGRWNTRPSRSANSATNRAPELGCSMSATTITLIRAGGT